MPAVNAQKQIDKRKRAAAAKAADPNVVKGEVPEVTLDELVDAKSRAKDLSAALSEAIKAQAMKYGIKPAALRKYVTAREADKLDEARVETQQLAHLMG